MSSEEGEKFNDWQNFGWKVSADQVFYILRNGEQDTSGPFSQKEVENLLNGGSISPTDYIYYENLDGWKPLSQVFNLEPENPDFGTEGQDPIVVTESLEFINSLIQPGEQVYYIAVQELPALSLTAAVRLTSPKSIILTNQRICLLNPRLMGAMEYDEYPLENIGSGMKRIKPEKGLGNFVVVLKNEEWVEINKLPFAQLEKLEALVAGLIESPSNV